MSDAEKKSAPPAPATPDAGAMPDRRTNTVLRALVSEMLERVRELSRRTAAWSPEERAQAEAELEAIMVSVRKQATHGVGEG
ncbi:MAG TPA: hypothetical protein VEI06_00975 [Gemmatimonadaceae bacterium]|nr:hypothetical protein [Gemmatimonadaceae bacterium]